MFISPGKWQSTPEYFRAFSLLRISINIHKPFLLNKSKERQLDDKYYIFPFYQTLPPKLLYRNSQAITGGQFMEFFCLFALSIFQIFSNYTFYFWNCFRKTLENGMATYSSILAWEIPWTEDPCRLQSMGLQRAGHNWATNTHKKIPTPPLLFLKISIQQNSPEIH